MLTHWIPDGTLGITHPSRAPGQHQRLHVWAPCIYCSFKLPHKCLKHSSWEFSVVSQKALRTTDLVQYLFILIISPRILAPCHHPFGLYTYFQKICNSDLKAFRGWEPPHSQKLFSSSSDVLLLLSKQRMHHFCCGRSRIEEFDNFVSSPSLYHL